MNLNKVILIGRIASDINAVDSRSGVHFVRVNIAITRDSFSNEREDITDFVTTVAFRNNATFLTKYCNKGDLVNIVGSLQSSQYTTKSGDVVSSLSVIIDQIKLLEPRSVTQARAERNSTTIANKGNTNYDNTIPVFYNDEDDKKSSSGNDENPWELDF